MRLGIVAALGAVLASTTCSESTPSTAIQTTAATRQGSAAVQMATVSGKAGAASIVVLEPQGAETLPASDPAVMDQFSLTFTPEMLFARTGQPVEFRNSDDTLHNVHVGNSDTREPAFNVAIPTGGKYTYTFTNDGFYHVACDIHPAMSAEILSVSTPFAAVTDASGAFSFADVEPGTYVVRVYDHGSMTKQDVEIKSGANTIAIAP
jgi:plastocyanin